MASERVTKYLVAVNAGGIITTLGFIGSAQTLGPNQWVTATSLLSFCLGLTICGWQLFRSARGARLEVFRRMKLRNALLNSEISASEYRKHQEAGQESISKVSFLFWPAFLSFITGTLSSAISILAHVL